MSDTEDMSDIVVVRHCQRSNKGNERNKTTKVVYKQF